MLNFLPFQDENFKSCICTWKSLLITKHHSSKELKRSGKGKLCWFSSMNLTKENFFQFFCTAVRCLNNRPLPIGNNAVGTYEAALSMEGTLHTQI